MGLSTAQAGMSLGIGTGGTSSIPCSRRYRPFGARLQLMVERWRASEEEEDRRHDDGRVAGDRALREQHREVQEREQEREEEEDARCDCRMQAKRTR